MKANNYLRFIFIIQLMLVINSCKQEDEFVRFEYQALIEEPYYETEFNQEIIVNAAIDDRSKAHQLEFSQEDIIIENNNGQVQSCLITDNKSFQCLFRPRENFVGLAQIHFKIKNRVDQISEGKIKVNVLPPPREYVQKMNNIDMEKTDSSVMIVFALDISGSMKPYLNHLSKTIDHFLEEIFDRGFRAKLAFINSNNRYKSANYVKTEHPDYPGDSRAYIENWDYIPKSDANVMKFFNVNASYSGQNSQERLDNLANLKSQILSYIDGLPVGVANDSDDERLLCQTLRFLHTSEAKSMDYMGIVSISNEEDAYNAKLQHPNDLERAYKDCTTGLRKVFVPKSSCSTSVSCEYGEEGCSGNFTFNWKYTRTNQIQQKVSGTCTKSVPIYGTAQRNVCIGTFSSPELKYVKVGEREKTVASTPDNPSGKIIEDIYEWVPTGQLTYAYNKRFETTCENFSDTTWTLVEASNVSEEYTTSTVVGYRDESYACNNLLGSCSDYADIMVNGTCYISQQASTTTSTVSSTPYQSNTNLTCDQLLTGAVSNLNLGDDPRDCSVVWSGSKTVVQDPMTCSSYKLEEKTLNYTLLNEEGTKTLPKAIKNKLNSYQKSTFVSIANDLQMNLADIRLAEDLDLELPSSDCNHLEENMSLFPGYYESNAFKELVGFLGNFGAFYSICSPKSYPSDKLDLLVEHGQKSIAIPNIAYPSELIVDSVKLIYADNESLELEAGRDYKVQGNNLVFSSLALIQYLSEIQVEYREIDDQSPMFQYWPIAEKTGISISSN
ncbi:MAG: hypothetical protein H6622_09840 [Halobacteriovoraceae bacterium]|nr:hypothetical protein [Halobacteriovoraceae bacterium]